MRINMMLRKSFLGGVVALMVCMSMSAMAEKQWVFIQLPTSVEGLPGGRTLNETCAKIAQHWTNPLFSYKAVDGQHGVGQDGGVHIGRMACYFLSKAVPFDTWHDSGAGTSTGAWICDEGQHFIYDPADDSMGCYEWMEQEFVMNHESCEGKDYPDSKGRRPLGGVTCDNPDGQKYTCFWPQNIRDNTDNEQEWDDYDDTAKDIIERCTRAHEQNHIDDNEREHVCMDGRDGRKNPIAGWFSERDAYQVEMTCLTDNISSCNNDKCMREIGEAYSNASTEYVRYDNCINNPSQCL